MNEQMLLLYTILKFIKNNHDNIFNIPETIATPIKDILSEADINKSIISN